jgi:glutamine amidotransferase
MISVIDYGLGNIQAFVNIYDRLGIPCSVAHDTSGLSQASHLILPGVGAFDWAMHRLELSGLRPALDDLVLNHQVPILGICVGMQMMANRSEEGQLPGLGWIPGVVTRFDENLLSSKTGLPHMGWNDVVPKPHPLFANIQDPYFYFLHSYFFLPDASSHILSETEFGIRFASAVCKNHVVGVQFHPEKSHHWGAKLLKNFAEIQY